MLLAGGCTDKDAVQQPGAATEGVTTQAAVSAQETGEHPEITGLVWQEREQMQYAEGFTIDCYEGGYRLLTVCDGKQVLTVPEGEEIPQGLAENVIVLQQPVDQLYMLASASMDMFVAMDALDRIAYCGTQAEGWYIPEAKEAVENGSIKYAGKYSAPDYEMLLENGCRLAIENTMITHKPEVVDKLEELGIPVLIDYASYESHPMGRMEWIRFYGALCGCEDQAKEAFDQQVADAGNFENTGKTVAFFSISSNGVAVVRRSDDYVAEMIRLAGGEYILADMFGENHLSTENMQLEEFYAQAKDADYIVYNGTTSGEIHSMQELLEKSDLLQNFRAVKEGHAYAVSKNFYQSTMSLGTVIGDLHNMLTDAPEEELVFLEKLE